MILEEDLDESNLNQVRPPPGKARRISVPSAYLQSCITRLCWLGSGILITNVSLNLLLEAEKDQKWMKLKLKTLMITLSACSLKQSCFVPARSGHSGITRAAMHTNGSGVPQFDAP